MDKFLETHNLSRLNHKEIKSVNTPITKKGIESVIKISQQREGPIPLIIRKMQIQTTIEKGRATHSPILAWIIPWREQPGGSQRVRHH